MDEKSCHKYRDIEQHNVIFILDEIQMGVGRTGKLLAEEHEGVVPNLTLIGKNRTDSPFQISGFNFEYELLLGWAIRFFRVIRDSLISVRF